MPIFCVGLLAYNKKNARILLICHPCYAKWLENISERMEMNGSIVDTSDDLQTLQALTAFLKRKKEASEKYDTLSLIPGHGCYPLKETIVDVEGKPQREMCQAHPGIVWSDVATAKPICGNSLARLINLCYEVCDHLHLGTCHQGCSLNLYEDMLCCTALERRVTISGWTHAVMVDRDDVFDKFHIHGCHCVSFRQRQGYYILAYKVKELHLIRKRK